MANNKVNPTDFRLAEYVLRSWSASPESGTKIADVLNPLFWSHISANLKINDKIIVTPQGGAFYAELLVKDCGKFGAHVVELVFKSLHEEAGEETPGTRYEAKYRGPHAKWSVLRLSDNEILVEGLATKDEAALWLEANEAQLAA